MQPVEAGGRTIGPGAACFVAVETGLNHNGDLDLAHRLIDAGADCGADGVKFQDYRTEDFLADRSVTYEYESGGRRIRERQYDMFKRYELPETAWPELAAHCAERGVMFFATPTSEAALERLVRLGVPLLKNGSDYLVHLPLIREMARTGIATALSTGMATEDEIALAVQAFREAGGHQLVLLHCTSAYPAPAEELNLCKIPALAERFDCPVGLSDHSEGTVAALASVVLGGCMIEKHFTLDRTLPGPDHRFSSDPEELRALVQAVRTAERALGSGELVPAPSEEVGRRDYRLSCVAARDLEAGRLLDDGDVVFRRPGTGLQPADLDRFLGRRLARALSAGTPLHAGDFA